jgi:hypothetical protein
MTPFAVIADVDGNRSKPFSKTLRGAVFVTL